jgi:acyl-CoA synthetase (AMP-forming)/AMP-acid ligase II
MFDHIAGIDTYFYSLFSGGIAVLPISRSPEYICNLIEQHKIEVLPTSPTFLNILLMSEKYQKYDLKSLKIITFGSEAMPEFLLNQLKIKFKGIKLIQKYGMTEFGSPNSKTNKRDSSWLKLNSDKFKTKIIDDVLYIKTGTTMVGYLNSPSPFTHDGWFKTGDTVEVSGDYIKILGRKSEIINVGGEKVYPQEIENVLLKIDNICEALVYGEKNAILGSIVCAKIWLKKKEDHKIIVAKIKKYCSKKIERYKIPVKIKISSKKQYNKNYKKIRTL